MTQIVEDFGNASKAISQQSIDGLAQMATIFEVRLAESLKRLERERFLEGAKMSRKTMKEPESCKGGAHREVLDCVPMLSTYRNDVRKVESIDALAPGSISKEEAGH